MIVLLDRELLVLTAAVDGSDPLAEIEANMRNDPTAVVTDYQQGQMVGLRSVSPFAGSLSVDNEVWNGEFLIQDRFFWRDYTLDLDAFLDTGEVDEMAAPYLSMIDFVVSVDLPTEIADANGQIDASGKKVTWNLVPARRHHLTLTARQYLYGRIGAVGAVLLAAIIGLIVAFTRRGRPAATPDQPAHHMNA